MHCKDTKTLELIPLRKTDNAPATIHADPECLIQKKMNVKIIQ